MKAFADLVVRLDDAVSADEMVAAMADYFAETPPEDATWAVYFLIGRRTGRPVRSSDLREWAAEASGLPRWLFDQSCSAVGDLAEAIALLLPDGRAGSNRPLHYWAERRLLPLRHFREEQQHTEVRAAWSELDATQRFVWNKLMTTGVRWSVTERQVVRALAAVANVEEVTVRHRLSGDWAPTAQFYRQLVAEDTSDAERSRPYPFCLAQTLGSVPSKLGPRTEWQVEWKWDGIRAQIVRRSSRVFIWSHTRELLTDQFPEVQESARILRNGIVLDGMLIARRDGCVLPSGRLQRRLGRKRVSSKLLREVPASFLAFDVLEHKSTDVRRHPLRERRALLEEIIPWKRTGLRIERSPLIEAMDWEELASLHRECRERLADGLLVKHLDGTYEEPGTWLNWKAEPYRIDAVLVYAEQRQIAGAPADYTFAVWDGDDLVPFAAARDGLSDAEVKEIDRFVLEHTTERFGPVRALEPKLVFEIGFEGIFRSTRRKSGVDVRNPRVLRGRPDKTSRDADSLAALHALLPASGDAE